MKHHRSIREIIEEMLSLLGVDFSDITMTESGDVGGVRFVIKSNDSGILIGNKGEHLQALSYIVKRIVEKESSDDASHSNHFFIDVNDYHERQLRILKEEARILAERARTFKHEVPMEPHNPYERMVVHALFADTPDIETSSEGFGASRHVVIRYKNASNDSITAL